MGKILSIVVPSYNAEKYLLDSIPTMVKAKNADDIDIIIVNDGSPDNTLEVAKNFQQKYPNIVQVVDKENGGHGSTINSGIKCARGKYFKVIDADDWVDTQALEKLVEYLKVTTSDIILNPYHEVFVDSNTTNLVTINKVSEKKQYQYSDFLSKNGFLPQMHMITIKTSILVNNHIEIGEKMFYVDMEYVIFPTPFIKTAEVLNDSVYQYRLGTLTQSVSVNSFIKNRQMHEKVILRIVNYLNTVQMDDITRDIVSKRVMLMIDRHAKVLLAMKETKKAKQEFIALEKNIEKVNPYYTTHTISHIITLLRKSHYALFGVLSVIVKIRNKYLSKK